jgi:hypothetical protein
LSDMPAFCPHPAPAHRHVPQAPKSGAYAAFFGERALRAEETAKLVGPALFGGRVLGPASVDRRVLEQFALVLGELDWGLTATWQYRSPGCSNARP